MWELFLKFIHPSILFSLLIFVPTIAIGQAKEFKRVNNSANQFIELFRESLDFGVAFDKMFVSDAVSRMRKAKNFQNFGLSAELEATADDELLKKFYKANMNFYYLKGLCDIETVSENEFSPEVTEYLESSKFAKLLLNEDEDGTIITTDNEIKQFTAELNNIVDLYRKCIPRDLFNSKMYETQLKSLAIKQSPNLQILNGYENLGVKKGTKVYLLEKDLFVFYFVKENEGFKVLTVGIGN